MKKGSGWDVSVEMLRASPRGGQGRWAGPGVAGPGRDPSYSSQPPGWAGQAQGPRGSQGDFLGTRQTPGRGRPAAGVGSGPKEPCWQPWAWAGTERCCGPPGGAAVHGMRVALAGAQSDGSQTAAGSPGGAECGLRARGSESGLMGKWWKEVTVSCAFPKSPYFCLSFHTLRVYGAESCYLARARESRGGLRGIKRSAEPAGFGAPAKAILGGIGSLLRVWLRERAHVGPEPRLRLPGQRAPTALRA